MDINGLKIRLLKKIIACKDKAVLGKIEILLQEVQVDAEEPGEDYEVKSSEFIVPDKVYAELDKDFKAYKTGKLKTESWEKVDRELKEKYGF